MTFAAFGFLSFLFYRIGSVLLFGESVSLIACLILTILAVGITMAAKIYWGAAMDQKIALAVTDGIKSDEAALGKLIVIYSPALLVSTGALLVSGWLVVLGFSETFYERIVEGRRYDDMFNPDNAFMFGMMLVAPVLLLVGFEMVRTYMLLRTTFSPR